MLRPLLALGVLLGSVTLAGCTDKLSFSGATLEEPAFDLAPLTGDKDTVFSADASALAEYNLTWDWGDGTFSHGPKVEHKYGFTNGVMTVTLFVTDEAGKQGFASREVTLGTGVNKDPTATLRASRSWVEVGKGVTLTAGGSDPDRDPLTYLWTRAKVTDAGTGESVVVPGDAKSNLVTFDEAGRWLVTVRAQDPKGGTATAQTFLEVSKVIPPNRFEALFNGTLRVGTAGAAASEKLWVASPPAPDTEADVIRHAYTLKYPGNTLIFLTWNDTSGAGAIDLDLELRDAETNETVFRSETHAVNPASPGAPTPIPPFEYNVSAQEAGTYWVIVRAHTGANVAYSVLVHSTLKLTPELVRQVEGE